MNYPFYRQCPSGTSPYTVKAGDTLYRISQKYFTTVAAIIAANPGINPNLLYIGQQLCIPGQPSYPNCPEGNSYTVKPGDTLFAISRFFNVSVDDIIEANPGINPNLLFLGQVICIPLATPPITCAQGNFSYTVRRGDTFYSISQRYGITVVSLAYANPRVNPNALLIGQRLCIPVQGKRYTNPTYNVTFLYPLNWRFVNDTRYEGDDGFFQISAISGNTLEEVCRNEALHVLKPYGSQPTIISLKIAGQDACLILPYPDQPPEMKDQAALIVIYPKPVTINGQNYNFFILWADKSHIREISNTLTFIRR
jgi:LysM repeat protein